MDESQREKFGKIPSDTQLTEVRTVETCQNLLNLLQVVIFTQQTIHSRYGRTSRTATTGLERRVVNLPRISFEAVFPKVYMFSGTKPTRDISSSVRPFQIQMPLGNLISNQKPRRATRNGNLPSSDHQCQSTNCLSSITQGVGNTLPGKRTLITAAQILLHLHLQPDHLSNSLLLASLGITSFNSSNNRYRVDTMVNNQYMANRNQSPTLLSNSANLTSLDRKDSDCKLPTSSLLLLIHESCNNHPQKSFCPQMRL